MVVMVFMQAQYVRYAEVYLGEGDDGLGSYESRTGGWAEDNGDMLLNTVEDAESIEAAIKEVAESYGCPLERLRGVRVFMN